MQIKRAKANKLSTITTILLLVCAFIIGLIEGYNSGMPLAALMIFPLYFLGLFGSLLGIVPFVGPVLYFYGIGNLFDWLLKSLNLSIPIAQALLFYMFLAYSMLFCIISSLIFIVWVFSK